MGNTGDKTPYLTAQVPQVVLHPDNNDLFVRTGRQVIDSCRLGISVDLWVKEFISMSEDVKQWCNARQGRILACYVSLRSKVRLFFIPSTDTFDFELADELAALNIHVVKTYNIGMVEILQIPLEEVENFLDAGTAIGIYGQPKPQDSESHRSVEA